MVGQEHSQQRAEAVEQQIRAYVQILKNDPRSRVFAPLARLLLECGYSEQAERVCRKGLEYHPDFSEGLLLLAKILLARDQPQQAAETVGRVLEMNPRDTQALLLLARIEKDRGKKEEAVGLCMQVLDLDPQNDQAQQILRELSLKSPNPRHVAATSPIQGKERAPKISPLSLFADELPKVSLEAVAKVSDEEQPFSALSSGSYPHLEKLEANSVNESLPPVSSGPELQSQLGVDAQPVALGFWMNPAYIQKVIDREGPKGQEAVGGLSLDEKLKVPRNRSFLIWVALALLCGLLAWRFKSYWHTLSATTRERSLAVQPLTEEKPSSAGSLSDTVPGSDSVESVPEQAKPEAVEVQKIEPPKIEKPEAEKVQKPGKSPLRRAASKRRRRP